MELLTLAGYVIALGLPVWLVIEELVHRFAPPVETTEATKAAEPRKRHAELLPGRAA